MAYLRRRDRMKALERVLDAAKALVASLSQGSDAQKVIALVKLKDAMNAADRLPPPNGDELNS